MASLDISALTSEQLDDLKQQIVDRQNAQSKEKLIDKLFNYPSDPRFSDACFIKPGQTGDHNFDMKNVIDNGLDGNVLFVYAGNTEQLRNLLNGKQPDNAGGSACIAGSENAFPIVTCQCVESNGYILEGFKSLTQIVYMGKVKMTVENLIDFNFNCLSTHFSDSNFIHMRIPKDPKTNLWSSSIVKVDQKVLDYINKKIIELKKQFIDS
jgi:hypothetical protein